MNFTLYVPAQNCCNLEVCKTSCLMVGHPTFLGIGILLIITIVAALIIYYLR